MRENKPSNNLKYLNLKRLIEIRERGYESQYYRGHFYDKHLVEQEIVNKLRDKKGEDV